MNTEFTNFNQLIKNYQEESSDSLNRAIDICYFFNTSKNKIDHINELFRIMHSLKGNSSLLGFVDIKKLCHNCEAILSIYREDTNKCNQEGILVIQETLFFIKDSIQNFSDHEIPFNENQSTHLFNKIAKYITTIENKDQNQLWADLMTNINIFDQLIDKETTACHDAWTPITTNITLILQDLVKKNIITDEQKINNSKQFDPKEKLITLLNLANNDTLTDTQVQEIFLLLNDINEMATATTQIFANEALDEYTTSLAIDGFTSFLAEILLDKIHKIELKQTGNISQKKFLTNVKNIPIAEMNQKSIRVDETNLDNLLNQISELIIVNEVYSHIHKRFEFNARMNTDVISLKKNNEILANITSKIQQELSSIRKVSLKQMSFKAQQIVTEISQKQKKEIEISIIGDDLFIDKSLFDTLQDPFVHLVRNAADHGIESEQNRRSKQKPEKGNITITFSEDSENFYLIIKDDGKGIDANEIVREAISKGLITADASLIMTNQQKLNLLTLPGFSTIDNATEFSGRGVGLDIVQKNISRLNGSLEIESQLNHYTQIKTSLPKNVFINIINGFLVTCNNIICVLPITSVGESFKVTSSEITSIPSGDECLKKHNKVYNVKRLNDLLKIKNTNLSSHEKIGVIINSDSKSDILLVDDVLGTQQIVSKSVKGLQINSPIINGFAILGNEKIAIMLDIDLIFKT